MHYSLVIESMFNFLRKDPLKQLESRRRVLLEEAMHIQRSGDLRRYAEKITAISDLEKEIQRLMDNSTPGSGTQNH